MTIIEHQGDLLAVPSGILVHGCNTLGVMGAGIARAIKLKYPSAFEAYREEHEVNGLPLGHVVFVRVNGPDEPTKVIANAMTQDRLARFDGDVVVSYEAIHDAFTLVRAQAEQLELPVHFPLIGCGLAGGEWAKVAPLIEDALGPKISKHLWRF